MQVRSPSDIAMLIRSVRRSRNLSQQQLAERLDVSRAWIVQIEQGKPSVRLDLVLRVINELGIALSTSDEKKSEEPLSEPAVEEGIYDIDAIADTGLHADERPAGKLPSKRRR